MTEKESDGFTGRLVRKYQDNERNICCLRGMIKEMGKAWSPLVNHMLTMPESLRAVDDGFSYWKEGESVKLDVDRLRSLVSDLEGAMKEKADMEECLKGLGLDGVIRTGWGRS